MDIKDVVAISAVRTPMGRFGGTLKDLQGYDLGAVAIREAVARAGVDPGEIGEVLFGMCRQAGTGPNPARTAAVRSGLPISVPCQTINMACPSGMAAMISASRNIRMGEAAVCVTGGMESMSNIPYFLKGARFAGFRMGDKVLEDGWSDNVDPLCGYKMGVTAENLVEKHGISREAQDEFALRSHRLAAAAQENGWFDAEITPVPVPAEGKQKAPTVLSADESIRRDSSLEKLARLPGAFKDGGSVTAGNSCGMTDGAAAGLALSDVDAIEVNEAFAAQVLTNEKMLGWDREKVNMHGGAIALGHPIGISGARIVVTLLGVLRRTGGEIGLAGICGAGGVSTAMVIRRET